MKNPVELLVVAIGTASAFSIGGAPKAFPRNAVAPAQTAPEDACLIDEPVVECALRRQLDGPWADAWAKYVLLRPGMSYSELKEATRKRNQLDPSERIPGTARTVVLTHAACFLVAIPTLLASEAILPKLIEAAAVSRVASGIP